VQRLSGKGRWPATGAVGRGEGRRPARGAVGRDVDGGATCGWRAGEGMGFAFFGALGKVAYRNVVLEWIFSRWRSENARE
jgi:hypothetical protein